MNIADLQETLKRSSVKKLLAIFPHPDDESFCVGGLFQLAQKNNIFVSLITLTKGERGINSFGSGNLGKIREKELKKASKILGVDEVVLWNYPDVNLKNTQKKWSTKLKKEIMRINPDLVITFDHSGITGHPDHIVVSTEVLRILKDIKNPPLLFWRVPDDQEKNYFKKNSALKFASQPTHVLNFGFRETLEKLRSIYAHESQMKSFAFRIQILEWFLFDHKELYCKVDLNKKFDYQFVLVETKK